MLENLTQHFGNLLDHLRTRKLTEANVDQAIRKIRIALIESEVNLDVIKSFIDQVKETALGEKVIKNVTSSQLFVRIVHNALVETLGGEKRPDIILKEPTRTSHLLLSGLQGAGKTTTLAKIAHRYREKRDILTVSLDIHRPAAAEQLKILSEKAGVSYFDRGNDKNIKSIVKKAKKFAKQNLKNFILFDSAGRTQIDSKMLGELKLIYEMVDPDESIFICDSMLGQQALQMAMEFKKTIPLNSLIFTKFDSDTRGGAILSVQHVVNVPIRYLGMGEKLDDLDEFDPKRIADRILGMGDIVGLVNKAQTNLEEDQVENLALKMKQGTFDLGDFLTQIQQMKKMGSMESLLAMIPGLGASVKNPNLEEGKISRMEAIIRSMTPDEREKNFLINNSRKVRISKGSGTNIMEINQMLKKFSMMKKMMKKMSNQKKVGKIFSGDLGQSINDLNLTGLSNPGQKPFPLK